MNIILRTHLRIKNGLPHFEIPEFANVPWLRHAFLTRRGGVSLPPYDTLNVSHRNGDREELVSKNKTLIGEAFYFDPGLLVLLQQMHRDKILLMKEPSNALPFLLEYDAIITNLPGFLISILTADCVPIFAVDQKKKVIAAIHAGRQGTALHITEKVLKKMEEEFGCSRKDLLIALGPSIGSSCYEIDERVFQPEWGPFSTPKGEGRWMIDLAQINIAQMKQEGVGEEQISWINLCTHCQFDLFFSYRREGRTGRQLSFIGII